MSALPILFNGAMVRAILEGRKTQTRRVAPISALDIKHHDNDMVTWGVKFSKPIKGSLGSYSGGRFSDDQARRIIASQYGPYGQPGNRLWVRETWQGPLLDSEEHEAQLREDGPNAFKKPGFCAYRATDTLDAVDSDGNDLGWRPSIHMPRWASRITLDITGVRVERLSDISHDDAEAEGVGLRRISETDHRWIDYMDKDGSRTFGDPRHSYWSLWKSIYGESSHDANPWVWVVEFKRVKGGSA